MEPKSQTFMIKGMRRDLSKGIFDSNYAFEINNMRITTREDNTLLSLTNEKGNMELSISNLSSIDGILLGWCVLNEYIILFTKDTTPVDPLKPDFIYRIQATDNAFLGTMLFNGNLNFNVNYLIESLGVYENEDIQKVYWVDGYNQARMINIVKTGNTDSEAYDFTVNLNLQETVSITKNTSSNGMFASGVIQYAFTYFNLYGQESNIFHTTPLQYIAFSDRGGSPEEAIGNTFQIKVNNVDTKFDYIRIYSIYRTSINGTPVVKRLTDISLLGKSNITYIDNGLQGDIIDPTLLLYIGGEKIIAETLNQKDNTLFLGNLEISRPSISKILKDDIKTKASISFQPKEIAYQPTASGAYPYYNTLNKSSSVITTFKQREWYRFGLIFQHKTGKWSDVVWVGDALNNQTIGYNQDSNNNTSLVKAVVTITDNVNVDILNKLRAAGYIKAKGVVVYPTMADRNIICQGVLNPTVYNVKDRYSNSPFVQSSWFTRPMAPANVSDAENNVEGQIPYGSWTEFRHNTQLPSTTKRNAEIQNHGGPEVSPYVIEDDVSSWVENNKHRYYVDQSIVTLHSPDIEFDDQLKFVDMSNLELKIVGIVPITGTQMDVNIQTSSPANSGMLNSFYNEFEGTQNVSNYGFRGMVSGAMWHDTLSDPTDTNNKTIYGFPVYPWHRNGSLNNAEDVTEGKILPAVLSKKKMSNLRFSTYTKYGTTSWRPQTGNVSPVIFNANEVSLVKIDAPMNSGLTNLYYYGNIDSVSYAASSYPITYTNGVASHNLFVNSYNNLNLSSKNSSTKSIRIKYKSTPHAVIAFNYTNDGKQVILPSLGSTNMVIQPQYNLERPFWERSFSGGTMKQINYYTNTTPTFPKLGEVWCKETDKLLQVYNGTQWSYPSTNIGDIYYYKFENTYTYFIVVQHSPTTYVAIYNNSGNSIQQDYYSLSSDGYGALYMAELCRNNVISRFGGIDEGALLNNVWIPAGPEVDLRGISGSFSVEYKEGDTYFQRYDHLKTYPSTMEDVNSVTDIVSFMVETRVNIDGRYDKNRGNKNNLTTTPANFNLINPIYNQTNNFFVYRPLNTTLFSQNVFPNTITWSLTKTAASLTDTWTNITLASTLDLDGDKGKITSLDMFNNELYCFQEKGLSNILYNSRVQIQGSDGVPIEIANSGKVSGKRYISNTVGCYNKYSIVTTPQGIYFMDNITNSIYHFDGQQLQSISDMKGLRQWVSDHNVVKHWDPVNFKNFISFYDANNNDIYFTLDNTSLVYSELLGEFTGFMSYGSTPAMFNVNEKFYAFKNGKLWEQFAGEYNIYYDTHQPYSITFVANGDKVLKDRIFNYVEFKTDMYDQYNTYLPIHTFDILQVDTEHQSSTSILLDTLGQPSNLKKKFNIWRAQIPRDSSNGRDRIRNPWMYLKLGRLCNDTHRMQLHNTTVYYNE